MSLVGELNNIADELVECYANLKNNLIAKGVECNEDDKMSSLIEKTNSSLYAVSITGVGDNYYLKRDKTRYTIVGTNTLISTYEFNLSGDFRISASFQEYYSSGGGRYLAELYRNGQKVNSVEFLISNHTAGSSFADILGVESGDELKFYARNYYNNNDYYGYLTEWNISCNVEISF